jgi:hypothetical protein
MSWIDDKNTDKFDKLDFCLQNHKGEIIVTLLVNQVPLYDYITQKEAENKCKTKEEKNEFLLDAYNFDVYHGQEVKDEQLFYHNFPHNISL